MAAARFTTDAQYSHETWGGFHKTNRNLRLIVALAMYPSLMVLAMDLVSYDELSIISQDTIDHSAS